MANAAMARLGRLWSSSSISFLTNSLVVFILLFDCGTWTLQVITGRMIKAFENMLSISFIGHKTTENVRNMTVALHFHKNLSSRLSNDESLLGLYTSSDTNSVKDIAPRNARGRSLSRPSEEKLYGQCERMDLPSHR
ncbi:hypothetical protein DPMN_001475 [Dreissena polymorpha]|uniref:Uncharacterized protein n=1 Tax=Dreissena polymorpha TaxID=45954 RepID=A0A9D4MK44_DREPO|nr:hypothetical protein DPMN_001475 [Dreissena polymorpha]